MKEMERKCENLKRDTKRILLDFTIWAPFFVFTACCKKVFTIKEKPVWQLKVP